MVFRIYQVCHNIENQIPKLYGDERLSVQKVKAISLNFFQLRVFQWQCCYRVIYVDVNNRLHLYLMCRDFSTPYIAAEQ